MASFVPGTMLAVGGNSGNILYDVSLIYEEAIYC